MNINEKLNKAFRVVPLTQTDHRLDSQSELTLIKSRLKVAKVGLNEADLGLGTKPPAPPAPAPEEAPQEGPFDDLPPVDDEGDVGLDGGGDEPAPEDEGEESGGEGEEGGATPSGNNYSIDMAKQQLDGIISNWMDLAGEYPEGEQRHEFIEIGERLREISGVMERDYIDNKKPENEEKSLEGLADELGDELGSPSETLNKAEAPAAPEEAPAPEMPDEDAELSAAINQATGK